jgi:hypothetical protein
MTTMIHLRDLVFIPELDREGRMEEEVEELFMLVPQRWRIERDRQQE